MENWIHYFESNFGVVIEPNYTEMPISGLYHDGFIHLYKPSLKTLFHEMGHHFIAEGLIGYKGNPWVTKYFRSIPKEWILSYPSHEREEEVIVESMARWGVDGGVNREYMDLLTKLSGKRPT